jgi:tRNA modification GTPase
VTKDGDTLSTLATPPGEGGIHVLLLAGPRAGALVRDLFRGRRSPPETPEHPVLLHGFLKDEGETLDEILLAAFPPAHPGAPPLFELNLHGGPVVARLVLEALARRGAVPVPWPRFLAEAGPTLGADRLAVAALRALPEARSETEAALLARNAAGALTRATSAALGPLRTYLRGGAEEDLEAFRRALGGLLALAPVSRVLADPPMVLISGPPNAGKSTLFNALLGEDRALVDAAPGTTRDPVRESALLGGLPALLCDAAGIADDPADPVEKESVRRAGTLWEQARVILLLEAPDAPLPPGFPRHAHEGARLLRIASKADLPSGTPPEGLAVSARTGEGLGTLRREILSAVDPALLEDREGPLPWPPAFLGLLTETADRFSKEEGKPPPLEDIARGLGTWTELSA